MAVSFAGALGGLALAVAAGCSGGTAPKPDGEDPAARAARELRAPGGPTGTGPLAAGPASPPADTSRVVVQHGPEIQVSRGERSGRLVDVALDEADEEPEADHPVLPRPDPSGPPVTASGPDPVIQSKAGVMSLPATLLNFPGQGTGLTGFDVNSIPPDTNGAVGPDHYVQAVNTELAIWDKSGKLVFGPVKFSSIWAGYVGTNPGNGCAKKNDGDPIVLYDALADRWFVSQFSLPNYPKTPAFQCVAVSQTGDPTGSYYLYDYAYQAVVNDYPKFGVWPDGYYGTFDLFDSRLNFQGGDLCAMDRVAMLSGAPAAQVCFPQSSAPPADGGVAGQPAYAALPVTLDGKVPPPRGQPGQFVDLGVDTRGNFNSTLDLWSLHLDWAVPANSALTGPTVLTVQPYRAGCYQCVPEPAPGNTVQSLADRLMFRAAYRNFGTHESLTLNHAVSASAAMGLRWYELWSPSTAPVIHQQGTYAPADGNWRWMASIAQDQAEDFALGFSISSPTLFPSIGWTGRVAGDAPGVMGQGEAIFDNGTGTESGPDAGAKYRRWGDYSAMTVDPTDDCTFWYTQELYAHDGFSWATLIASFFKFPGCAANDFSIAVQPGYRTVAQGGQVTYQVKTTRVAGTAETLALNVQDLPPGVTGSFSPATVLAGSSSTLTLTATASAPATPVPDTFMVIGTAPSAVHPATSDVFVGTCTPVSACPSPDNCGVIDNCGTPLSCGPACAALDECHLAGSCSGNVCSQPIKVDGTACSSGTCQGGVCTVGPVDAGSDSGHARDGGKDSGGGDGGGKDAGTDSGAGKDSGTAMDSGSAMDSSAADASGSADSAAGMDASQPFDSGAALDSGSLADAAAGDGSGDGSPAGDDGGGGGCGCRTAGSGPTPLGAMLGIGGFGFAVVARRRRTRR